jgi:periplasmic protein TonB
MFGEYATAITSHNSHRGWTTLISFTIQSLAVTALLLVPLLSIQGLPALQWTAVLSVPPPAPSPAPRTEVRASETPVSNMRGRQLMLPGRIPREIADLNETEPPPAPEFPGGSGVPGATGSPGSGSGVPFSIGSGTNSMPILSTPPVIRSVRVSQMMEGNLIHRVQPDYPPLARQARIQGTVVLRAIINREGRIENLQVLSGHPMLVPAAIDAVRQWRYRPYVLNDQPVEVETQITVNFLLAGG